MSLTELAETTGIQIATLSRIEHQKMTGTLGSHIKIAQALGLTITELYESIALENKSIEVHTEESEAEHFVHNDKSSFEILTTKLLSKKMMPMLLKIAPLGQTTLEEQRAGSEKFIYIVKGNITAHIEGKDFTLNQNDTLYFNASLPHYFINKGKQEARVLCILTPVSL
jgi:glyoxylate utilization-related uncharacterized protein